MRRDWTRALGCLLRHFRALSRGRFWTRAAQLFVRCAPQQIVTADSSVKVLAPVPLVFPFAEYRAAMDSAVAANAAWVHRMKVQRPGAPDVEILVLHRSPRQ